MAACAKKTTCPHIFHEFRPHRASASQREGPIPTSQTITACVYFWNLRLLSDRTRCSLESALPAMPPKWRPLFSADYLAPRPKRFPVELSLPQVRSGRLSLYSPTRASIPESEASISNHAVRHNSQITLATFGRICVIHRTPFVFKTETPKVVKGAPLTPRLRFAS